MTERYLESLAILLAGLFSAERLRSKGIFSALAEPNAAEEPDSATPPHAQTEQ
jgi:hypothetical protein